MFKEGYLADFGTVSQKQRAAIFQKTGQDVWEHYSYLVPATAVTIGNPPAPSRIGNLTVSPNIGTPMAIPTNYPVPVSPSPAAPPPSAAPAPPMQPGGGGGGGGGSSTPEAKEPQEKKKPDYMKYGMYALAVIGVLLIFKKMS